MGCLKLAYCKDKSTLKVVYRDFESNENSCAGGCRYGFNGMEKDDEVYGAGNLNTAQFWKYDTRLGIRWNIDPVDQVSISNYACFKNNSIFLNDPFGNSTTSDRTSVTDKISVKGGEQNITLDNNKNIQDYIKKSEEEMARGLSEKTGLNVKFDDNGLMTYEKLENGDPLFRDRKYSQTARKDLLDLIDDKNFNISINWSNSKDVWSGLSTRRDINNKRLIAGSLYMDLNDFKNNVPFFDFALTFLHEIQHGYFGLKDDYTPRSYDSYGNLVSYGYSGETVIKVSNYERELGYPERITYETNSGESKSTFFRITEKRLTKKGKVKYVSFIITAEF